MVRALGERFLDEDEDVDCVWCGDSIEHDGVIRTTDSQPACWDCVESKPWESDV